MAKFQLRNVCVAVIAGLILMLLPTMQAQAARYDSWYYGNWGGPGYSNGSIGGDVLSCADAVDDLDRAFRAHDLAYAAANAQYRPLLQAARLRDRPAIRTRWIAAYVRANNRLRAAAASLPTLVVQRNGRDNWGGRNVGASRLHREAYRAAMTRVIYLPPPW